MPILEASNVIRLYKQYDVTITAVDRVNLSVEDGESSRAWFVRLREEYASARVRRA